ncbi:MAG: minor capsid protein [Lysobacter sp.]
MNLNPFRKNTDPTRNQRGDLAAATREAMSMGPWSSTFGQWQPRAHTPWLYEALREAVPVLDGGINRLVTVDGIIEVEGGNDKLTAEIAEWMRNVPVNDLETGYQAFYASQGAEHYEQGVGIGEFVYDGKGRDVIGLRVADSKGLEFARDSDRMRIFYRAPTNRGDTRRDGLGSVESLLRGTVRGDTCGALLAAGYVDLEPRQLVVALNQPEADNPYGTSILRSVPFVAQILLKMQNATGRSWERFGDPPFHVSYSTKNRKIDNATALSRARQIVADLATAMAAKAKGNSVDLATGAGADDEIKIAIIGAAGEALEIGEPARHMLEQVVAAFGLPPWMLGITWSQASGIGEQQSVVVLQEAQTRFERRGPGLHKPIEAMLRARGRTWKPGDWKLVQRLPNLMDEAKRAQAAFLRAQTALMLGESGQPGAPALGTGVDNNLRSAGRHVHTRPSKGTKASEDGDESEPWAEDDEELPLIEARTVAAVLAVWFTLGDDVLRVLGLDAPEGERFDSALDLLAPLMSAGELAAASMAAVLLDGQTAAFDRGVINAGIELSTDFDDTEVRIAVARMHERARGFYRERGLELVRGGMSRRFQTRIVAALASGEFDGMNPQYVATTLRQRFGGGNANWERLARSETARAQAHGKRDHMREQGVTQYDFVTAATGACPTCRRLARNGPYDIDAASSPVPVDDSHPSCRCTITPRQ